MLTIYEAPTFVAEAAKVWTTEDRLEFCAWIATNSDADVVIPHSGSCRKVRWARPGSGKQGGVRVIYFTQLAEGRLCMLLVYPKSQRDDIPAHLLKQIRQVLEDDHP